jgi:hypothetical protein
MPVDGEERQELLLFSGGQWMLLMVRHLPYPFERRKGSPIQFLVAEKGSSLWLPTDASTFQEPDQFHYIARVATGGTETLEMLFPLGMVVGSVDGKGWVYIWVNGAASLYMGGILASGLPPPPREIVFDGEHGYWCSFLH